MGNASKDVAVCIPHVPIPALQNATGTLHVRHARRPVASSVVTPDALRNVLSHVPLVQYQNVCPHVRIARVPCLAPRRVITFHALADVRNIYRAAINARPYVDISVDFILGQTYKEIDLDENPCIFPPCGHFLTVESMDAQMDLGKHYMLDEMGKPFSISKSSEPFSISDVPNCATCRGSLRSISRYGRLVRRALLDEATKKFILYLNQKYVPMAQELAQLVAQLPDHEGTAAAKAFQNDLTLKVQGPPDHQIRLMHQHLKKNDSTRWKDMILLRQQVTEYYQNVKVEEQPFNQVRNMVEDARRRKRKTGQFEFDETVLQTKGCIQAASLLLRLDTALIGDFLTLYKQTPGGSNKCVLHLDLQANRKEGEKLTAMAVTSQRVLQQVEGYLFRAQLCALECQSSDQPTRADDLLSEGNECIEQAQKLCATHQVHGLADEIEGTLKMLRGSTFYTPVTSEERMAVVAAMAREFRGTGHWYRCVNGHFFTIGECGGAMQISTCSECGARIGGQGHQTVAGVTRAADLEENLARLII
ncbi:NF-X1 finger and helicase domain protein [Aspergillus bombycis]|uniref:NF-X1 finger and helicase domain protein n=1 Tax=Aspergillus bombycis TaxID=109264 RepID=A0A1F7ZWM6_9EURO|nr:NF-X1 finger and helicase domain protein [Aspergillus bombycis]OGM43850.1 NF-X1 finger and helicase domain protein [Aspergillus bombycis]